MFVRKNIRLGKHIHLNVTKNGLSSVTFGGKNARLGIRKDGSTYASANKDGIYARQELTGRNTGKRNRRQKGFFDSLIQLQEASYNLKETRREHKEFVRTLNNRKWVNWFIANFVMLVVGIAIIPILFIDLISWIVFLGFFIKYKVNKRKA